MNGRVAPEDILRSNFYSLVARLLASPPDEPLFVLLYQIPADTEQDTPMSSAWVLLREAALQADLNAEKEEYERLFHDISSGALMPYGSWYQTGLLAGNPLLETRKDLNRLGFLAAAGNVEPEDHAGALCETMAMLCRNSRFSSAEQRFFFHRHLAPWIERFFSDLTQVAETKFYKAAGNIGRIFFSIEAGYLS